MRHDDLPTHINPESAKLTLRDCLVAVFTYNNGSDLETTLRRFGADFPFPVVVHVDGSTDGSDACLKDFPSFAILRNPANKGIGRSVKNVIEYARLHSYKVIAL